MSAGDMDRALDDALDGAGDLDAGERSECEKHYRDLFNDTLLPAMNLEQLIWLTWATGWIFEGD